MRIESKKENRQLVHLARVRYELMIRLILTLGSKRNEHIIIFQIVEDINQAELIIVSQTKDPTLSNVICLSTKVR